MALLFFVVYLVSFSVSADNTSSKTEKKETSVKNDKKKLFLKILFCFGYVTRYPKPRLSGIFCFFVF